MQIENHHTRPYKRVKAMTATEIAVKSPALAREPPIAPFLGVVVVVVDEFGLDLQADVKLERTGMYCDKEASTFFNLETSWICWMKQAEQRKVALVARGVKLVKIEDGSF